MKIILLISTMPFLLMACKQRKSRSKEILEEFKRVDSSLQRTSELSNPLRDTIGVLTPAQQRVAENAAELINYIDSLQTILKTKPDDDMEAAMQLMVTQKNGAMLYHRLQSFEETASLAAANDSAAGKIRAIIERSLQMSPPPNSPERWAKQHFEMVPVVTALTLLSKYKNDITLCLRICLSKPAATGVSLY
jgi:hypothetical protein